MVATGSGIAPMLSLLQERDVTWARGASDGAFTLRAWLLKRGLLA